MRTSLKLLSNFLEVILCLKYGGATLIVTIPKVDVPQTLVILDQLAITTLV